MLDYIAAHTERYRLQRTIIYAYTLDSVLVLSAIVFMVRREDNIKIDLKEIECEIM
jgi:hypothetical protein